MYEIHNLTAKTPEGIFPNHRFNAVVNYMGSLVPHSYTSGQYASFEEMKKDYLQTGRIKINVDNSENTIFCSMSTNWNFRAWHDMCHILADADFTAEGEKQAEQLMIEQLYALPDVSTEDKEYFAKLIHAEVSGQVDYYVANNAFPVNQLEFTRQYLGIA